MHVYIRVDGSTSIGTGHVMRCVLLAEMLIQAGAAVSFLMRTGQGHLCDWMEQKGFQVFSMREGTFTQSEDADEVIAILNDQARLDWMIVDHYGLDEQWDNKIRPHVRHIAVIDDLANRKHTCKLLLDQNYAPNFEQRYDSLVPSSCQLFLGPSYLLLRPEFLHIRQLVRKRAGNIERLLVFYGGSDPTNETMKVLEALEFSRINGIYVDVVVGNANPVRSAIQEQCARLNFQYHCQIDYLSLLMDGADFSFGAGGVTMWERCYLGLPSVVTIVADNQRESTEATARFGAIWNIGFYDDVCVQDYVNVLHRALINPISMVKMSERALRLLGNSTEAGMHPVVKTILEG
ncbi:UDP-2,4-diacetamido-2,4,6-trideoxy-beta-L-altropyranose hydrolase [Paenibacillus oryzisoli]|uniref:UDP-2,4-diacetamido-2,4, 6-trideoxy-beta-L-altropyranose hydrolase n=1 Tax=Paenibacillus oryzisoli TaxID=1850517 RepID=A0A197ZZ64_9BACL|nr:UDP-2,4-diacetamido-2,4,6-trideoxy-beta-L-altropyranose hydrolase [Paenibacillus oryzisoli]OAS14499.1 UDP-2,4-diacetamido-2,4,6-trideoxy-beta-L-altropyranose hydrolase [Paenibacillus oryzisoli]